jgi:molybdopterin-containing oxidoreductase family membrane subunit
VAEIKHILKRSGENYKAKMGDAEKETVEEFAHEMLHAH